MTPWWLIFSILLVSGAASFAQDHLVPEEGILNARDYQWNYSEKLRMALLKDAAQYFTARLVCKPSFDPEWVVTVVQECGEKEYLPDHPHRYYVEYAEAEKNLWYAENFRNVKVKRTRVSLDRETAEAIAEVWRRMLLRVQYPQKPETGRIDDGTSLHFARAVPLFHAGSGDLRGGFQQGYLKTPSISPRGSMTSGLIAIGEALKTYALAEAEDRDMLRLKIRAEADRPDRGEHPQRLPARSARADQEPDSPISAARMPGTSASSWRSGGSPGDSRAALSQSTFQVGAATTHVGY
jgi:hypothetical protein